MGNIIETISTVCLAIPLGFLFSAELTGITFLFIVLVFVLAAVYILFQARLRDRIANYLQQASSVKFSLHSFLQICAYYINCFIFLIDNFKSISAYAYSQTISNRDRTIEKIQ